MILLSFLFLAALLMFDHFKNVHDLHSTIHGKTHNGG
jgi:hypothetical protein